MISTNIRRLREKKHVSQDRLSKLADLSLNTIVKIESGRNSNPRIATLLKIAKSLEVGISDLVKAVLILFFLGSCIHFAYCEEVSGRKIPINLTEAISLSYQNNKEIKMEEEEINFSKAGITQARSEFLPKVHLETSYTHNDVVLPTPGLLSTKKDIGVVAGYKDDNKVGIAADQVIYDGGSNIANFKQAKLSLNSSFQSLRAKKLDVEFEARRLYYGLLLAYETERISQQLVDQAQSHYEDVEKKFAEGTASRFDLLQSKVQVSKVTPELVKAKNSIEQITADLKKLLGLKTEDMISVKESLGFSQIEINEKDFLRQAYMEKPEMILKSLGVDINKWGIQMAKSGWRPHIDAAGVYNWRSNDFGDMFNERHSNWQAGVNVSFPIFDAWSSKAKVDQAKARYRESILDKDNLADQIAVDIRKACLDLNQAQAIIDSQKDNVGEAKEALRISIVSFDNGVGTNLDVFDSQVSLAQVELNLSQAVYDYLMAEAFLDRTRGRSILEEAKNEKKT